MLKNGLLALWLSLVLVACGGPTVKDSGEPGGGEAASEQDGPEKGTAEQTGQEQADATQPDEPKVGAGATDEEPSGQLVLVESWPAETTLDHAEIADASTRWVELIDGAEKTLEFAEFYGSNAPSSSLEAVIKAVERAADRGVSVRFIFDKKFYEGQPEVPDRLSEIPGVELRILDLGAISDGVLHAKYFLVDRQRAFLGSQNFDWRSLTQIHELGVELDNPELVAALAAVFDYDWKLSGALEAEYGAAVPTGPTTTSYQPVLAPGDAQSVTVYPALSPKALVPEGSWDLPQLLERIENAQDRIRVQLMSYGVVNYDKTEFRELDDALREAAERGVKIQMLLADWSKRKWSIKPIQSLQTVDNIEVKLVTIPQSSTGFIPYARVIHAKYMTVDDHWSWIGTGNWSGDYFYKSRNVGVVVDGSALAADLDAFFEDLWDSDYAVTVDPEAEYEPPRISVQGWGQLGSDLAQADAAHRVVR